jgi:hypothetical protein
MQTINWNVKVAAGQVAQFTAWHTVDFRGLEEVTVRMCLNHVYTSETKSTRIGLCKFEGVARAMGETLLSGAK